MSPAQSTLVIQIPRKTTKREPVMPLGRWPPGPPWAVPRAMVGYMDVVPYLPESLGTGWMTETAPVGAVGSILAGGREGNMKILVDNVDAVIDGNFG